VPPRLYRVAHIVLVGTSLLRRLAGEARDPQSRVATILRGHGYDPYEVAGAAEKCLSPSLDEVEAAKCLSGDLNRLLVRAGADLLGDMPEASAELTAMKPWLQALLEGGRGAVARVDLIATDTVQGKLAAHALREYFQRLGVPAEVWVAEGLGVPGRFVAGLKSLKDLVSRRAAEAMAEHAVNLNLTGGFKIENAIAMYAAAGKVDAAYYRHEAMRDTVVVPLRPLVDPQAHRILEDLKPAERRGWLQLENPPEWVARLVSAVAATGLARIDGGQALISQELADIIRALAPSQD